MDSVVLTWTVDSFRTLEEFAGHKNVITAVQVSIKAEDLFGGALTDVRIIPLDVFDLPTTITDINLLTEHQVLSWILRQLGPVEVAAIEARTTRDAIDLVNGWNINQVTPPWLSSDQRII